MIRSVDGNLAREKDLKLTTGVYVDSIAANSAAGKAGVNVGDVIYKVDGYEVRSSGELLELIGRHRPGDEVILEINRKGKSKTYSVTLRNLDGKTEMVEKHTEEILEVLGVKLEEIDRETERKLNIQGGVKIIKIGQGQISRQTDLKEGFIVTKVDGQQVKSIDDFKKALEAKSGGVMIEGVYEEYPGTYYYAFGL
jgi:S1-C subfamily serine protease